MTTTEAIDPIFVFILGSCLVLFLGITGAMVWFVYRYHRSRAPEPTSQRDGSLWLEIAWTVLPTLLVMAMFYYGWAGFLTLRNAPPGALPVTAVARMWSWTFQYPDGQKSDKLYVPVGKPVQVTLESRDVNHGFYVPAFRVKRDVIPGMKNQVWFSAPKPGSYDIFCSQYCGTSHSAMISTVEALPEAEFAAWLKKGTGGAAHPALALFEKHGCLGCHSLDGAKKIGPTFQGIWGRKTEVKSAGKERELVADEGYLRRSIMEPSADLVVGYPPVMPAFAAQLTEDEVRQMIDYFKGQGQPAGPGGHGAGHGEHAVDAAALAKAKGCLACHSLDGSRGVGPSLKGIFGTQVKVTRGGKPATVTVDEAYLRESIVSPAATLVEGFPPVMPPAELEKEEVEALVRFIKELK